MANERVRITRFDVWFLRAMWVGLLAVLASLAIYIAVIAIGIATAGQEGAGRQAGILLALQAILMVTLAWGALRTPRAWRWISTRAASDAPYVAARKYHARIGHVYRMTEWLRKTWRETDSAKDTVPSEAELSDDNLRAVGLNDAAIKKLKANPHNFPHTLRRLGYDFGRVRGKGFAERMVGAAHYMWSRRLA